MGGPGLGFLRHDEKGNLDPGLQLFHVRPHVRLGNGVRCDPFRGRYAYGGLALGNASEGNQPCLPKQNTVTAGSPGVLCQPCTLTTKTLQRGHSSSNNHVLQLSQHDCLPFWVVLPNLIERNTQQRMPTMPPETISATSVTFSTPRCTSDCMISLIPNPKTTPHYASISEVGC